MGFKLQLYGFLKRNLKLKIRNKVQLLPEIYNPLSILAVLVIFSFVFKSEKYEPEKYKAENLPFSSRFDLYITPSNSETIQLGNLLKQNILSIFQLKFFNQTSEMKKLYLNSSEESLIYGLEFTNLDKFPFEYKIHHNYEDDLIYKNKYLLNTNSKECRKNSTIYYKGCAGNKMVYNGLSTLKFYLDLNIKKYANKPSFDYSNIRIQNMDKESYVKEQVILTGISSFYFTLFYMYSLITFVTNVVDEKEKRLKETMRMMGMLDSAFWISWILIYLIPLSVLNFIIAILMFSINFFKSFNLTILFFFLIEFYSIVTIIFGMLFSTFFQKSKSAGAASGSFYTILSLFYFVIFIPRQFGTEIPVWAQYLLGLFFPCAFSLGIDQMIFTQATYGSYFSSELFFNSVRPNGISIFACFLMLFIDAILYYLLTIYFENVIQGEYGRAQNFLFFLRPSFWSAKIHNKKLSNEDWLELNGDENYEPVDSSFDNKIALRIKNLVKTFKNENKVSYNAINKLSLNIYMDQITAILGHNGAGKTTLFNILTGLIKPDSGIARFYNYDVLSNDDLFQIRKLSGICPQQNVLYDSLNCVEHLELFAYLKGIPRKEIKSKTEELLRKVDLYDSKDQLSKNLSGGQKRKLNIAIALIGDPKILILDEPTSGMDPTSRRAIWGLLQTLRKNRVILLTTHFMDEADILADRKAIISKGKLKCVGSSLFLKNKFGLGYHLNCIGTQNLNKVELNQFITNYIPGSELEKLYGNEVSFRLPMNSVSNFQSLFQKLETESKSLGIKNLAISMTTLEEVFLRLAETGDDHEQTENIDLNNNNVYILKNDSVDTKTSLRWKFFNFIPVQVYMIMKLRFLLSYRNKMTFIYRFLAPLPSILLTILLPKLIKPSIDYDPNNLPIINLNINEYATNENKFVLVNKTNQNLDEIISKNLIVNDKIMPQPFLSLNQESNFVSSYSGFIFENVSNMTIKNLILLYNDSGLLTMPYLINTLSNFYSRLDNSELINASLTTWPKNVSKNSANFDSSTFSSLIILGTSLIIPLVSFATEIVHDRELKCKAQLTLSGCTFINYWASSIFCFLAQYILLPILLFAIIYLIPPLNIPYFMPAGAVFTIFLTTLIYIPCILMFAVCLSFLFDKKETTIGVLTTLFMLLFIIPFMATSFTKLSNIQTHNMLHIVFSLLDPIYGYIGAYSKISDVYLEQQKQDIFNNKEFTGVPFKLYFEFENFFIPVSIIFGVFNIFLYTFLLYYIESFKQGINLINYLLDRKRLRMNIKQNSDIISNEDLDVSQERNRVNNSMVEDSPLVLQEIRKEFSKSKLSFNLFARPAEKKVAVRNLSIGFKNSEIFGLLGPNGAGKTTTISLITLEQKPDAGQIKICNKPLNMKNLNTFYQNAGICPQHDPFWPEITLREHLSLYAAIKKIPEHLILRTCSDYMNMLGITEHADKKSKNLSGGTKRKLSFAISIFASPNVVLLDEPSTGLDPQAKRTFWNVISKIFSNQNKSAILTTHSMEEAEALCQRIGIVVKGELKCLGSSQYLKEKFGMGYTLEAKIKNTNEQEFSRFVDELFFGYAKLSESFSNRFVYNVSKEGLKSLAYVFQNLEKAKLDGLLEEYSFSQCTLEQIFIKFAKEQDL
nr:ATP-binding cassette transporter Abca5 [Brachionus angularis]